MRICQTLSIGQCPCQNLEKFLRRSNRERPFVMSFSNNAKFKRLSKLENTQTRKKKMLDQTTQAEVQVIVLERVRSRYLRKSSGAQNLTRFTRTVVIIRNVMVLSVWPTRK